MVVVVVEVVVVVVVVVDIVVVVVSVFWAEEQPNKSRPNEIRETRSIILFSMFPPN